MTINCFLKCEECGKIIRLRWQIGADFVPFSILCPNCNCCIEGELKMIGLIESFNDLQGAKEVFNVTDADYIQEISTELFVSKMADNVNAPIITPFIRTADYIINNQKYISNLIDISNNISIYKKEMSHIFSLYANAKYDFMKNKLYSQKNLLLNDFKQHIKNSTLDSAADYFKFYVEYFKYGLINFISSNTKKEWKNIENDLKATLQMERQEMKNFVKTLSDKSFYIENRNSFNLLVNDYLGMFKSLLPLYIINFDLTKTDLKLDGITTVSYSKLENMYKKCYEFVGHNCLLIIGLNNLIERGNINSFKNKTKDLFDYIDRSTSKYQIFKDSVLQGERFSNYFYNCMDNVIRNSEAHFSTSYDIMSQEITFKNKNSKGIVTTNKKYLAEFANIVSQLFFKCYLLWCVSSYLNDIHFKKNMGLKPKFSIM